MNLPNRLTLLRVVLIPVCLGLMYAATPPCDIAAFAVFLLACLTDFLDGHIARTRHLTSDLGKFLDPVADKLLVLSVLTLLTAQGKIAAWMVILVLARELMVDGLRLAAMLKGKVIAAGKLGKIKTVSQMAAISLAIVNNWPFGAFPMQEILAYAMAALTLWSGVDYFLKNPKILVDGEAQP